MNEVKDLDKHLADLLWKMQDLYLQIARIDHSIHFREKKLDKRIHQLEMRNNGLAISLINMLDGRVNEIEKKLNII